MKEHTRYGKCKKCKIAFAWKAVNVGDNKAPKESQARCSKCNGPLRKTTADIGYPIIEKIPNWKGNTSE